MTEAKNAGDDRWLFAIPAGLALVLVVLGAMLVVLDRHEAAVAASMRSWPSTTGTVASSGLRDERQQDGRWAQYAETTFRYEVDGRSYDFTSSEFAGWGTSGHEHLLRYHANEPVRVFYDPADPSQGSLTNQRASPTILMLLIGAVCFALSLPFWYLSARMFVKQRRSSSAGASS